MSQPVRRTVVRIVIEIEVDPAAWYAAAIEAEHLYPGELDTSDSQAIAEYATEYIAAEELMPRWARDSMMVIHQTFEDVQ